MYVYSCHSKSELQLHTHRKRVNFCRFFLRFGTDLSKSHTRLNVRFRPRLVWRETTTQWSVDYRSSLVLPRILHTDGTTSIFLVARYLHYNRMV